VVSRNTNKPPAGGKVSGGKKRSPRWGGRREKESGGWYKGSPARKRDPQNSGKKRTVANNNPMTGPTKVPPERGNLYVGGSTGGNGNSGRSKEKIVGTGRRGKRRWGGVQKKEMKTEGVSKSQEGTGARLAGGTYAFCLEKKRASQPRKNQETHDHLGKKPKKPRKPVFGGPPGVGGWGAAGEGGKIRSRQGLGQRSKPTQSKNRRSPSGSWRGHAVRAQKEKMLCPPKPDEGHQERDRKGNAQLAQRKIESVTVKGSGGERRRGSQKTHKIPKVGKKKVRLKKKLGVETQGEQEGIKKG